MMFGPVLVVDDDPIFAAVAETSLKAIGQTDVLCAENGEIGINLLINSEEPIHLIILDINMPELDGLGFMRCASDAGFTGDIIISSGESDKVIQSAQTMGRMLGMNILGALSKPLNTDEFLALVKRSNHSRIATRHSAPEANSAEITKEMLVPFYQPQYRASDRSLVGAEALTRINLGDGRFMTPLAFFQRIGQSSVSTVIAKHVARNVFADMRDWASRGLSSKISINVDASVLERPAFVPSFLEITETAGIEPSSIVLELTETTIANDASRLLEAVTRLVIAGFELALDDYGTGSSNFELLKNLPFSEIKIDSSIIQAIGDDPLSLSFVEQTANFAQSLHLKLVAEGIETEEQLHTVRDLGVEVVQGFLFSKALPSEEYTTLLAGAQAEGSADGEGQPRLMKIA